MPKTEIFLDGQRAVIMKQLKEAKSLILVAMAYFTDEGLFNLLFKKAQEGLRVQLIVGDDEVNTMSGINYEILKTVNADFCLRKNVHHKFCVIDARTVLSGSYNWTNQARINHEDLTLIDDDIQTALMFMIKFFKIKDPAHFIKLAMQQDSYKSKERESSASKREERKAAIRKRIDDRLKGRSNPNSPS